MPKISIVHNPKCETSRRALRILEEAGIEHDIILYLQKKLTYKKIESLVKKLGFRPEQLIRKKEDVFQQNYKDKTFSDEEWIQILVENPVLIERPIIIKDQKAIIARPLELINKFLKIKLSI